MVCRLIEFPAYLANFPTFVFTFRRRIKSYSGHRDRPINSHHSIKNILCQNDGLLSDPSLL
jgi:hypothetical protein